MRTSCGSPNYAAPEVRLFSKIIIRTILLILLFLLLPMMLLILFANKKNRNNEKSHDTALQTMSNITWDFYLLMIIASIVNLIMMIYKNHDDERLLVEIFMLVPKWMFGVWVSFSTRYCAAHYLLMMRVFLTYSKK